MAEILAHPWLEGATSGIVYVPAPPVSELAKPLPSALHIDRDLFESLCVIWGRHADIERIRADLLSPAGQGTLAKAFYFLLQKHREQTMGEHGILMDIDQLLNAEGKVITKQYAAPRSKPGRHSLDLTRAMAVIPPSQYLRSERPAPQPPSRTPSPQQPPLTITTAVHTERAPSRPHPPSPVGPRPLKPRPQGARNSITIANQPSFVPNPDITRVRSQTVGPVSERREAAYAQTRPVPLPMQRKNVAVDIAHLQRPPTMGNSTHAGHSQSSQSSQHTASAVGSILAPVPVPAITAPVPPILAMPHSNEPSPGSPMTTTPRCPEVEMLDATHPYATASAAQTVPWDDIRPDPMLPPRIQRVEHRPVGDDARRNWSAPDYRYDASWAKVSGSENKENAIGSGRPTQEPACHSGGLGFGHSVPMAKEMGNVLFIHESANGQQAKKEKKGRRKCL